MEPLEPAQRRALRAKAHHLDPVVTIGHHGLTPAVLHEIDVALTAHELVKVRAAGDDRGAREDLIARICAELDCAPVQRIGKLLVVWRQRPAEATDVAAARSPVTRRGRGPARPAATHAAAATQGRRTAAMTPGRPGAPPGAPGATKPASRAPRGVPRAALPRRRRGV